MVALATVGVLGGTAMPATAAPKKVTVPVSVDWRTAQPEPSACSNYGIAAFPDRKDAAIP